MSELKSKCCGAKVIPHPQEFVCSNCGLSCLPIEVKVNTREIKDWEIKDNRAILPDEMSNKELSDWLRGLLYYNNNPEDFYYISEDLIEEIIKRLKGGKS